MDPLVYLAVGKRGRYRTQDNYPMEFDVVVVNTRERYGNVDYLIRPVSGQGERWVINYKVYFNDERNGS